MRVEVLQCSPHVPFIPTQQVAARSSDAGGMSNAHTTKRAEEKSIKSGVVKRGLEALMREELPSAQPQHS